MELHDQPVHLIRKLKPAQVEVTPKSLVLFRLGEVCNNDCPMCSNSGRPEAIIINKEALLTRVEMLWEKGFRRVVLTGGEPTIHPAFWDVVKALGQRGMAWDINTHGRGFADPEFAQRSKDEGLERAIVSLHSHIREKSMVIFGVKAAGHEETLKGIENLLGQGTWLMLNHVFTRQNLDDFPAFVAFCAERFGVDYILKVVFPSTLGKGGDWEGIRLRYQQVQPVLVKGLQVATEYGLKLVYESFPSCVLPNPHTKNIGRAGFGETHYLEDIAGDEVFAMENIEAALSVYPEKCGVCRLIERCPGISEDYVRRVGIQELTPQ
jgi:MoaA/NifB/PqqE/SkfB family radical SAM enzyme